MSRQHTREAHPTVARPTAPAAPSRAAASGGVMRPRPTEDEIRVLAYHKWVSAGQPQGDGVQFWTEAEQELLGRK
jgi:DUF2934 family protein